MDPVAIIIIAIGAVAGCLAAVAFPGSVLGLVRNIIVGILGAVVAGFLLSGFIPVAGVDGQFISATIGAVMMLIVVGACQPQS